eukprot:COSAG05_NODE_12811_length_453_cov_1.025424_1_plen_90_part_10
MDQPVSLLGALGLDGRDRVTDTDIRAAYRSLCLRHHPDKLRALLQDDEEIAAATARFVDIKSAFEILVGPDQSGPADAAAAFARGAGGVE